MEGYCVVVIAKMLSVYYAVCKSKVAVRGPHRVLHILIKVLSILRLDAQC
jgi:hypothetical protein